MANHKSAQKAARQALVRKTKNQSIRARCRTVVKRVRAALVTTAGKKEEAKNLLPSVLKEAQSVLMRAAHGNVIRTGTASRYISRLSEQVHRAMQ